MIHARFDSRAQDAEHVADAGVRRIGCRRVVPRGEMERWRDGQAQLGDSKTSEDEGKGGCGKRLPDESVSTT